MKFAKPLLAAKSRRNKLTILDAGCGRGELLDFLIPWGEVTAIDAFDYAVDFCRRHYNANVHKMLIQDMSFESNSFDFIFCVDAVEHIKDDLAAMKELYRVLKPQGFLIVTVPAFMSLWGYHDKNEGHVRRYTAATFRQLSHQAGFEIEQCRYFKFSYFLPLYLLRRYKIFVHKRSDDFYKVNPFVNRILSIILKAEATIVRKVRFPFGCSLIAVLSK